MSRGALALDQIPAIAIEVFEYDDGAVGFVARRLDKSYAVGQQGLIVPLEIIGVQKQEDASAGLVSDPAALE